MRELFTYLALVLVNAFCLVNVAFPDHDTLNQVSMALSVMALCVLTAAITRIR